MIRIDKDLLRWEAKRVWRLNAVPIRSNWKRRATSLKRSMAL